MSRWDTDRVIKQSITGSGEAVARHRAIIAGTADLSGGISLVRDFLLAYSVRKYFCARIIKRCAITRPEQTSQKPEIRSSANKIISVLHSFFKVHRNCRLRFVVPLTNRVSHRQNGYPATKRSIGGTKWHLPLNFLESAIKTNVCSDNGAVPNAQNQFHRSNIFQLDCDIFWRRVQFDDFFPLSGGV